MKNCCCLELLLTWVILALLLYLAVIFAPLLGPAAFLVVAATALFLVGVQGARKGFALLGWAVRPVAETLRYCAASQRDKFHQFNGLEAVVQPEPLRLAENVACVLVVTGTVAYALAGLMLTACEPTWWVSYIVLLSLVPASWWVWCFLVHNSSAEEERYLCAQWRCRFTRKETGELLGIRRKVLASRALAEVAGVLQSWSSKATHCI